MDLRFAGFKSCPLLGFFKDCCAVGLAIIKIDVGSSHYLTLDIYM